MYAQKTQRTYRPKYLLECTGTRILQLSCVNTMQAQKESGHRVIQTYPRFTKLSSYFWDSKCMTSGKRGQLTWDVKLVNLLQSVQIWHANCCNLFVLSFFYCSIFELRITTKLQGQISPSQVAGNTTPNWNKWQMIAVVAYWTVESSNTDKTST